MSDRTWREHKTWTLAGPQKSQLNKARKLQASQEKLKEMGRTERIETTAAGKLNQSKATKGKRPAETKKERKTSSRKCNKFARISARRVRDEHVRRNGDIWLEREGETKPIMPEAHETRFYFRPKGLNGY